jgi:mycothiol synthase
MEATLPITMIDFATASEHEYEALGQFENQMRLERLPDDPALPIADLVAPWRNLPDFVQIRAWVVWNAEQTAIVASGTVQMLLMDTNRHLADVMVQVLPAYRRQGLAHRLLAPIHEALVAGERSLGATAGLESHSNQLELANLDHAVLRRWLAAGEQATAFELGFWDGPYPEADLEAIAELSNVMNEQPYDDLEIEDFNLTPERLRQMDQAMFADGTRRLTFYVRERASGNLAGFTEVFWHTNRPHLARQGATGVFPAYRGSGLGRWLKAAMLERILRDFPSVRVVRTGNADSNAPMLRINNELGFKPYVAQVMWQMPTTTLASYLEASPHQAPAAVPPAA